MAPQRSPQHLIRLTDLTPDALGDLLELSTRLKRRGGRDRLAGRTVGLLFFRGSLRTRTSFESAMNQLGGHTIHLDAASDFWDLEARKGVAMDGAAPEHIVDAAAVLSCYLDAIGIRTRPAGASWEVDRRDEDIRSWARHAQVPVVNMESALWHPLQALADLMTLHETFGGDLRGKRLAICWTHSPTPASPSAVHSLLHASLIQGMDVRIAHPSGYELDEGVLDEARGLAGTHQGRLEITHELDEGLRDAHVVYARSWKSLGDYGNPTLAASRRARTTDWRLDEKRMQLGDEARLMHAMPVRRNVEVTDEVLDGPRSLIVEQAANRLHSQKALMLSLLRPQ